LSARKRFSVEGFAKGLYSLSIRERVGVRDSRCSVMAGESLLLASSLREEEQDKIVFF
jgi:hypothetical protein